MDCLVVMHKINNFYCRQAAGILKTFLYSGFAASLSEI